MSSVVVDEWMSLDGVVQAPGAPEEDTTGGFPHGGWHLPYFDEMSQGWVVDYLTEAGGFLLGRRTYEILGGYWATNSNPEEHVVAEPLNSKPKFVVATTLEEPLEWENSSLLRGDIAEAVRALKRHDGGDLHVMGSTQLVHTLIENDLVDEFRLMIDPIALGAASDCSLMMARSCHCGS
jgi:dihydrofolate reductase